jgi:hypothetical protein
MRVLSIARVPDQRYLTASIKLDPPGTLVVSVDRTAWSWSVLKKRGEARLVFRVAPNGEQYGPEQFDLLTQELSGRDLIAIGSKGQLVFGDGTEVTPTAVLPRDLLDNSQNRVRYTCDVALPGLGAIPDTE